MEGSLERCGSTRSPLLGPGAAHLNQKLELMGGGDCLRCRNKHMCNQEHSVCRGPGLQDQRAVGNECQDHC